MKRALLLGGIFAIASAEAAVFTDEVKSHFGEWDADHNGELSVAEIELGVASPKFTGAAAAAIATLRRLVRSKDTKLPPLTLENAGALAAGGQKSSRTSDVGAMFDAALQRIRSGSSLLVGPAKPGLDCLEQGKLGDCFCLAPMGALLNRNPADVERMFARTQDGSVSVTLGGGRVLEVPFPTDAERALMATTEDSGVWANCYEKAVGRLKMNEDDPEHHSELSVVTRGGSAGTMLSILTGHEIVRASCLPFRDKQLSEAEKQTQLNEIRRQMTSTQAVGRLICGGTASGRTTSGHRPPGVRGPHAYAILKYDAASDVVTLWDPHGDDFKPAAQPAGIQNGYVRKQGRMDVPLTELVQWFGGFSFETDRPLKE